MSRLNRYLFKKSAINIGGLIIFACIVLLLERMLRIFQVISNSVNPASDASAMIANLLPHYLGIAVPIALLLGITITVDRFSRSSELTAAMGAGISLTYMTRPFMLLAAILAVITLFIEGYMQPIGRYNYREIEHQVKQQSFTAVLREGTFTPVANRTFYAGTDKPGNAIGPIYIYERLYDGDRRTGLRITTAEEGQLIIRDDSGEPVLQLAEGQTHRVLQNRQLDGEFGFQGSSIVGAATPQPFRTRGEDERELTSIELYKNRDGRVYNSVEPQVNNAALHLRVGRAFVLLLLPFIAVPFGLNYGRNPSSAGIFIGIVMLISLQKALEFGQSLGANGIVAPWLGIWPIVGAMAVFAAVIFYRSAYGMGQPPLTSFSMFIDHLFKNIRRRIRIFQRRKLARI